MYVFSHHTIELLPNVQSNAHNHTYMLAVALLFLQGNVITMYHKIVDGFSPSTESLH